MTLVQRPNAWVLVDLEEATTLTYAPRVDPSPLTVSVPGRDPTLGALVVVITNDTPDAVQVSSVTFTVAVGKPGPEGAPLTPTTAGVKTLVSDTTRWSFTGPPGPVTSGTADYVLAPAVGSTAPLAAGASLYVEIYDFQTVQIPSTSTVTVAEVLGGGAPEFTTFAISTFPDGFFFDGLTVNVPSGSALVPVAQVATGTPVTLTWNSSVVNTASQTVYWSDAAAGQKHATPTKLGAWTSPPLTDDTTFVVAVKAKSIGDEPLMAALATSIAVQNPTIVAASITAGAANVTGELRAGTATVSGGLTAASANIGGRLSTKDAAIAGGLTAGSVSAGSGTFTGGLQANQAKVSMLGRTSILDSQGGSYVANTDALVMGSIWPPDNGVGIGIIMGRTQSGVQMIALGGRWSDSDTKTGYFFLPIAAGQSVGLTGTNLPPPFNAPRQFLWVPLGSPPAGKPAFEKVGDAPPSPTVQLPDLPQGGSP